MFPTPLPVTVHPVTFGPDKDAHGNLVKHEGADRSERAIGIAPAGTAEPIEANRSAVTWDQDLLVPPGFELGPHDEVTVLDFRYAVEGVIEDYTHGPFGFEPGGVVRLKRVEG